MKFQHIACLALLCLAAAGCKKNAVKSNEPPPLRIGLLAPITGVMSGHGNSMQKGATVGVAALNASGGIAGRPVELIVLDTQSNPALGSEKAKELVLSKNVDVLLGTGFSSETLAVIPTATSNKIPFVYALDGECKTQLAGQNVVNPYVYGSGFTERMVVRPFLQYFLREKAEGKPLRVYFLGGDYVYPRSTNGYARKVAEELGCEVVAEEYLDTNTSDYSATVQKILASGANLLVVTNPGESGVIFMKQAQLAHLPEKMLVTGFATFDQEAVQAMGENSEGVLCVNRYSMTLKNPENDRFLQDYRKQYGDDKFLPGPTAAAGTYGVLMALKAGYEKAGSFDAMALFKATRSLQVQLPQGEIQINAVNSIFDQHLYVMKIHQQQYEVVKDLGLQTHPAFEGSSVK